MEPFSKSNKQRNSNILFFTTFGRYYAVIRVGLRPRLDFGKKLFGDPVASCGVDLGGSTGPMETFYKSYEK